MSSSSSPSVTVQPRVVMSLRAIEIAHWQSLMDLFATLSFPLEVLPGLGVQTEQVIRPSRLNPRFLLKRVFSGLRIVSQRKLSLHWVRPKTLRRRPLPLGGNDPAAIGAGLGSLLPLRVSALSREVTS